VSTQLAGMLNSTTNIFLVGLMGSGKTTIGRALAKRLNKRFIDADHEIEARTGATIPLIFEIEGEASFRQREADVIRDLTAQEGIVLATGGGAVLNETSRQLLKERGYFTGGFGKWGLGGPDTSGEPIKQGFDRWFGYNCQAVAHNFLNNDMHYSVV